MSRKKIFKYLAYLLLGISILIYFYGLLYPSSAENIAGFILGLGAIASILSIESPTSFTKSIKESDWKFNKKNNDYFIYIPSDIHGMGKRPLCQAAILMDGRYVYAVAALGYDEDGGVWIEVTNRFTGHITVFQ